MELYKMPLVRKKDVTHSTAKIMSSIDYCFEIVYVRQTHITYVSMAISHATKTSLEEIEKIL